VYPPGTGSLNDGGAVKGVRGLFAAKKGLGLGKEKIFCCQLKSVTPQAAAAAARESPNFGVNVAFIDVSWEESDLGPALKTCTAPLTIASQCGGTIAIPCGLTKPPPEETRLCAPVPGSTRMTAWALVSATRMLPLASTAMPAGVTKNPPPE